MRKPPRPCGKCGQAAVRGGLCQRHYTQSDRRRGTSTERGYDSRHRLFRAVVLDRDKVCVLCVEEPATRADHYPWDRRELVRLGADPNDPRYGRGLCERCHNRHTALTHRD